MKNRCVRTVALILIIVLAMNSLSAYATVDNFGGFVVEPKASNYISSTAATISNTDGRVEVSFRIVGTGKMTSIGATQIQIKDSTGTVQKTFNYTTTSGMMSYNSIGHIGSVVYYGSASTRYYAVITFRSSNSTGSDTSTYVTSYG